MQIRDVVAATIDLAEADALTTVSLSTLVTPASGATEVRFRVRAFSSFVFFSVPPQDIVAGTPLAQEGQCASAARLLRLSGRLDAGPFLTTQDLNVDLTTTSATALGEISVSATPSGSTAALTCSRAAGVSIRCVAAAAHGTTLVGNGNVDPAGSSSFANLEFALDAPQRYRVQGTLASTLESLPGTVVVVLDVQLARTAGGAPVVSIHRNIGTLLVDESGQLEAGTYRLFIGAQSLCVVEGCPSPPETGQADVTLSLFP